MFNTEILSERIKKIRNRKDELIGIKNDLINERCKMFHEIRPCNHSITLNFGSSYAGVSVVTCLFCGRRDFAFHKNLELDYTESNLNPLEVRERLLNQLDKYLLINPNATYDDVFYYLKGLNRNNKVKTMMF